MALTPRGRRCKCKKLEQDQVLAFCSQSPPCVVALETRDGAHFWGREIGKLGHRVRLIKPTYVKPFVERQKNKRNTPAWRKASWLP